MWWVSLVTQTVKNLPADSWILDPRCLVQEDALEMGMTMHSSILAWRIPWTEEPDGLQSMILLRYSLITQLVKNTPAVQETLLQYWVEKIPCRMDRLPTSVFLGFFCGSAGKESACNVENLGWIHGLGRFLGEGKGYPFQYSGLENSMKYIVHEVTKSRTWLSSSHLQELSRTEWLTLSLFFSKRLVRHTLYIIYSIILWQYFTHSHCHALFHWIAIA